MRLRDLIDSDSFDVNGSCPKKQLQTVLSSVTWKSARFVTTTIWMAAAMMISVLWKKYC